MKIKDNGLEVFFWKTDDLIFNEFIRYYTNAVYILFF